MHLDVSTDLKNGMLANAIVSCHSQGDALMLFLRVVAYPVTTTPHFFNCSHL
jgi:hypothetical protein